MRGDLPTERTHFQLWKDSQRQLGITVISSEPGTCPYSSYSGLGNIGKVR